MSSRDDDYALWLLIAQTKDGAVRVRQKELERYGVSARQSALLFVVQAIGKEATPAKISRSLFREPHSVSGLLSRMENTGLVKRVKDLDRKNLVRVVLTEKGHEAYRQSTKPIRTIMSSLCEEERQQLRRCLKTLLSKVVEELGSESEIPFPRS